MMPLVTFKIAVLPLFVLSVHKLDMNHGTGCPSLVMRGGSKFGDVEEGNQSRPNKIDTNECRYLSPCILLFISSDAHLLGPFAFSPSHSSIRLNIITNAPLQHRHVPALPCLHTLIVMPCAIHPAVFKKNQNI